MTKKDNDILVLSINRVVGHLDYLQQF
jgi:hypothetical protein